MPKFNEVELWTIENWADAKLLEISMSNVREKYAEVFEEVLSNSTV